MRYRSPYLLRGNFPALQRRRTFYTAFVAMQSRLLRVETFHRRAETVLKIEPAHLAVGDYVQAGSFLQAHGTLHRLVFNRAKFTAADLTLVETHTRLLQCLGAQEAADHVSPDCLEVTHYSSSRTMRGSHSALNAESGASAGEERMKIDNL